VQCLKTDTFYIVPASMHCTPRDNATDE